MNANVEDRPTHGSAPGIQGMFLTNDLASRINRFSWATEFMAIATMELDGDRRMPTLYGCIGATLEIIAAEGLTIMSEIGDAERMVR